MARPDEVVLATYYTDYANPELLNKIPLSCSTILDVGGAQGALGAAYLAPKPNARVMGIGSDPQAAEHAGRRLSDVAWVNVDANPMPLEVTASIDCIIYGDVLKYLQDPWSLLNHYAAHLAPRGTVMVCMPNVEHWSFALKLLNGTGDYENEGILDRTHLRWFTSRTIADALASAWLALSDVLPRPINTEQTQQFASALAPELRAIGVDPAEYRKRAAPMQFIWRANKTTTRWCLLQMPAC